MPRLLFFLCLLGSRLSMAQLTYQTLYVDYDSTCTFKNLTIIPIRPKGPLPASGLVTLQEALQKGWVSLQEWGKGATDNVQQIKLYNHAARPVLVTAGELLAGGRQDRIIMTDTILQPGEQPQSLQVLCVEEGRWSKKEQPFVYHGYANARLRAVAGKSNNQATIWREIYQQLDSSHTTTPTMAYTSFRDNRELQAALQEYVRYFMHCLWEKDSTITGIVCLSGDQILGSDIFAGPSLFHSKLEALLTGYAEEAILYGAPARVPHVRVKAFLDPALIDEASQEEWLRRHGRLIRYRQRVIGLTVYHS